MNFGTYLNFVLALVFVLALIGLLAWLYRRFAVGGGFLKNARGPARLDVVETRPLDAKRRLVLVRRDRTEHLLLLGTGADIVVESGIAPEDGPPAAARGDAP